MDYSQKTRARHSLIGLASVSLFAVVLMPIQSKAQSDTHLNPVIAALEAGEVVYGLSTQDLSLSYAREVARAPVDFLYVDMEHSPMDFPALRTFLLAMGDKRRVLEKQSVQPDVTLFARFAPGPLDSEWVVKQALDLGLYGIIFNGVDTVSYTHLTLPTSDLV